MKHDESLVRFAAEMVLKLDIVGPTVQGIVYRRFDGERELFYPLDSWSDAGMLWEEARKKGVRMLLAGDPDDWEAEVYPEGGWQGLIHHANAGPRAITEAICRAYGWKEPKSSTPESAS